MQEEGIDLLLTSDRNLRYQQNLPDAGVQVLIIIALDNRLKALINSIETIEFGIHALENTQQYSKIDIR